MKHTQTIQIEQIINVDVTPCLKCGSTDIKLFDNGYWGGNSCGGICKSCGHRCSKSCPYDVNILDMAKVWNSNNDVDFLIQEKLSDIAELKDELQQLYVIKSRV